MSEDDWDFSKEVLCGLKLGRKARGVLAVRSSVGPSEIRRAFWKLARIYHPDLDKEALWSYWSPSARMTSNI